MVMPFECVFTASTRIRMPTPGDARFVTYIENDVDLKRLVGGVSGKSEEFYRNSLSAINDLRCLIVELLTTGLPIGRCGLITDSVSDECDIHVVLVKDHCGQGFGTEVAIALKELAAEMFPDKALTAKVHPDNAPSLAIISKLGLAQSGIVHSQSYDNGWLKFRGCLPPNHLTPM
jgi:RimJ/RimL family protein N-acetyltransferase